MNKSPNRFKNAAEAFAAIVVWGLLLWGAWRLASWGVPRLWAGAMSRWHSATRKESAFQKLPDAVKSKLASGLAAAGEGKWREAAAELDAARRLAPDAPELLLHQATAEYHLPGRQVRSLVLFHAFLELAPDSVSAPVARRRCREMEQEWESINRRIVAALLKSTEHLGQGHETLNYELDQIIHAAAALGLPDLVSEGLKRQTSANDATKRDVVYGLARSGHIKEAETHLIAKPAATDLDRFAGIVFQSQLGDLTDAAVMRGDFDSARKWVSQSLDASGTNSVRARMNQSAIQLLNCQLYANNLLAAVNTVEQMSEGPQRGAAQREMARSLLWELENIHRTKSAAGLAKLLAAATDSEINGVYQTVLHDWREAKKPDDSVKGRLDGVLDKIRPAASARDSNGLPAAQRRTRRAKLWLSAFERDLKSEVFTDFPAQLERAASSDDAREILELLRKLSFWTFERERIEQYLGWFGR